MRTLREIHNMLHTVYYCRNEPGWIRSIRIQWTTDVRLRDGAIF